MLEIKPTKPPAAPKKPLLALDTSGRCARVAIVANDGNELAATGRTGDRHASILLPLCSQLLDACKLKPADLGGVACGAGPGSFTGLRVGMAVAKGLALATGCPLFVVSSLQALALDMRAAFPEATVLVPCIDAGKGEVYVQFFSEGADTPTAKDAFQRFTAAVFDAEMAAKKGEDPVAAGTGVDRFFKNPKPAWRAIVDFEGPTAKSIAQLAHAQIPDDLDHVVPLYGRPPDITKPKTKPGP